MYRRPVLLPLGLHLKWMRRFRTSTSSSVIRYSRCSNCSPWRMLRSNRLFLKVSEQSAEPKRRPKRTLQPSRFRALLVVTAQGTGFSRAIARNARLRAAGTGRAPQSVCTTWRLIRCQHLRSQSTTQTRRWMRTRFTLTTSFLLFCICSTRRRRVHDRALGQQRWPQRRDQRLKLQLLRQRSFYP